MTFRVIRWTTGDVGRQALKAPIAKPAFELVGVYAHGADKVGRDAPNCAGSPNRPA